MSGYLTLAKEAVAVAPSEPEDPDELKRRKLDKAVRIGLVVSWSEYPEWIKLHDPTTGEWHEVKASESLPRVVEAANKYRKKGGVA